MSLSEYRVPNSNELSLFFGNFWAMPHFQAHLCKSKFQIPPTASDSWMMALPVINTRSLQYLRRCGGSGTQATSNLI